MLPLLKKQSPWENLGSFRSGSLFQVFCSTIYLSHCLVASLSFIEPPQTNIYVKFGYTTHPKAALEISMFYFATISYWLDALFRTISKTELKDFLHERSSDPPITNILSLGRLTILLKKNWGPFPNLKTSSTLNSSPDPNKFNCILHILDYFCL